MIIWFTARVPPETIPPWLLRPHGEAFFELHQGGGWDDPGGCYVGWVNIRSDGTIAFGEPGV